MKRLVVVFFFVILFFSCKNKEPIESQKITTSVSNNIYNLSGIAEIAKLTREIVRFEDFAISKNYSFISNYRQHFISITFPFSFYVNKINVQKGDNVKKGDTLFEINSEELNRALQSYKKTGDINLAQRLKASGISPNSETPITTLLIISPQEGTINQIKVREKELYSPQELALIQLKGDLILEGTIPVNDYTDDTMFVVLMENNNEMSANIIEKTISGTVIKVRLSIPMTISEPNSDKIIVKAKKPLSNVYKINKNAIWVKDNSNWVFIDKGDGIIEKREVKGFYENDNFIITEGVFENEKVITDDINIILRYTR